MTPEQHYTRGEDLLTQAEAAVDPAVGAQLARTALSNFLAALSGNELRDRGLRAKPPEVGDTVVIIAPTLVKGGRPRRIQAVVTTIGADGVVSADFEQPDGDIATITAPSEQFSVIAARRLP